LYEPVALAVHLEDVDVVGEAVEQRAGEALGSEGLGPLVERQVTGDQRGAALVAVVSGMWWKFSGGGLRAW